ncbi:MAG: Gfo/Idh/MocA family oxidoreductase [Planctomycetes bacterium]|nr:Gfo/Idh/MocA family oxidoreductase [Planctomycetota bacterium]
MAAKYRVGIIGRTGKGNYGHGLDRVWSEIPQTEVIAVADEHAGGRAAVAKKTSAKRSYADYREMLEKEKLDIVAVAPRWIDQHRDMILAVAEHGCHIYMEKPFCRTLEEADEIVQACEMRHLKLAIAHTNRYSPTRQVVRKLIADGAIGDVLEIRARGKEDGRGGGEDLWVLGTHMLDLMRTFAGDVETCFAQVTSKGKAITKADVYDGNEGIGPLAGDGVEAMYSFKNGITGFFASHRGRMGRPSRFGIQIFGSKGILEMTSGFLKTAFLLKDPAWSPGRSGAKWIPVSTNGIGKPEKTAGSSHGGNHIAVLDLIDAIEKDRQPISSVYDARAATEMIVSVFESHRLGGPVSFPLKNRKNPLTMLKD